MYGKTTATIQHYMNVVLSNRLSTVKVINSKIKSKIRFGCTFALLSVTLEPWAQCCSLLPSAFWRYSPSYHSHHIFLSRAGWSNALDQQQAQHGHGIQPYHVVWDSTLCAALLRVRRLQLGLVIAARVTAMPQAEAARDGGERTACLSHWRMVSARPATIFTLCSSLLLCSAFSGVHHKKSNCESNQVISKVQQVLKVARGAQQLFPRSISLTQTSVIKKTKLRKGNGGWGDQRDHQLCFNMTLVGR